MKYPGAPAPSAGDEKPPMPSDASRSSEMSNELWCQLRPGLVSLREDGIAVDPDRLAPRDSAVPPSRPSIHELFSMTPISSADSTPGPGSPPHAATTRCARTMGTERESVRDRRVERITPSSHDSGRRIEQIDPPGAPLDIVLDDRLRPLRLASLCRRPLQLRLGSRCLASPHGLDGQLDDEGRTHAERALDPDRAAVGLDDLPGDEEADAHPGVVARRDSALEPLEDPRRVLRSDADP